MSAKWASPMGESSSAFDTPSQISFAVAMSVLPLSLLSLYRLSGSSSTTNSRSILTGKTYYVDDWHARENQPQLTKENSMISGCLSTATVHAPPLSRSCDNCGIMRMRIRSATWHTSKR